MAKVLMVVGAIAMVAVVAAYPAATVVAIVVPLTCCLALVWWLTDSPVAVGRARKRTWFDRTATNGGWEDADDVARAPEPAPHEHHTAQVVVKGARRANSRF